MIRSIGANEQSKESKEKKQRSNVYGTQGKRANKHRNKGTNDQIGKEQGSKGEGRKGAKELRTKESQ